MKTKYFLAASLLFAASVTSAFATEATKCANSAINVNGTWYDCYVDFDWATGGFFHGANLGKLQTLELGGQTQAYANNEVWGSGFAEMHYRIDGTTSGMIQLNYYDYVYYGDSGETWMKFQSGGSNYTHTVIDISSLSDGEHTLEIWFFRGAYDSNNNKNYVAKFSKGSIPITNSSDITVSNATVDVKICGLTLFKDNCWNSLCLPFGLSSAEITSSPLAGATINKLTYSEFLDGTLTLTFENSTEIEAGVPYLIKWGSGNNITNPEFQGVTITQSQAGEFEGNFVNFKGTFDQITFDQANDHIYFLGEGNGLFYPEAGASIRAFGAYFELSNPLLVKAFQLNFDEETNSIQAISNETDAQNDGYYTIDGRRINGMPATSGLYILNGKKVMIK